jgi:small-conductance mechanosensitive channel
MIEKKMISKWILLTLLILSNFLCYSQRGETNLFNDSTAIKKPQAIPVLEVVKEIQIANEKTKEFKIKIKPNKDIQKIDSLVPIQENLIESRKNEAEVFIKANPNKQKINKILNTWQIYSSYFEAWQVTVNNSVQRNSRSIEEADFNEKTWKLTLDSAKSQDAPIEIVHNINSVWKDFRNIKNAFIAENNRCLTLESKINQLESITNDIIEQLEHLKTSDIYGVFYRRHAPLWKATIPKTKVELPHGGDEESSGIKLKNTLEFFKTFEHLIYLYIVIVFIIIGFIRYIKKGIALFEYDDKNTFLKKSLNLIYNKSGFIIAFICMIIAKFYFANAPKILEDSFTLLILVLTVPIVYKSLTEKFRNIVFVIIFFYIYNIVKAYIWFESYQYRAYLLLEALLVMLCLYYFTRPYRKTRKLPLKDLSLFFVKLTPVIYFLSLTSIIANVLGYSNLADISLKICTEGSAITLTFYGILRILEGTSLALVHRHYGPTAAFNHIKKIAIEKKILKLVQIIVFILWLLFFLNILDQFSSAVDFFNNILKEPYIIGTITFTIGDILSFILILISSFIVTSFIGFIIDGDEGALKFLKLPKGIPNAISLVIRYLILAFGIIFALSSLGIDLSKFNLMAGALGLGIGFGLQNVISNFVSGLILVFERPILPGDTVEVNNLLGTVNKIGIRSSNIGTFDGADVVVPNNNLVSNDLINWTLSNNIKRVEILVGTTYDSDPNSVLEILKQCALDYAETITDPPPMALFSDFGDSSLNFRLRFWVHFEMGLQAKSDVSIAIYNKFKEHGIEIPFPQQDVYIKDRTKKEGS